MSFYIKKEDSFESSLLGYPKTMGVFKVRGQVRGLHFRGQLRGPSWGSKSYKYSSYMDCIFYL